VDMDQPSAKSWEYRIRPAHLNVTNHRYGGISRGVPFGWVAFFYTWRKWFSPVYDEANKLSGKPFNVNIDY